MIKMTALSMGFYKGAMVRPGAHFEFDVKDGDLPKWAVPFGTPPAPAPTPFGAGHAVTLEEVRESHERRQRAGLADPRPLDVQLAVHLKTGTRPSDPVELHGFF